MHCIALHYGYIPIQITYMMVGRCLHDKFHDLILECYSFSFLFVLFCHSWCFTLVAVLCSITYGAATRPVALYVLQLYSRVASHVLVSRRMDTTYH